MIYITTKHLRFIAVFMCSLIVTIPFYVAGVYGANVLNAVEYSGEDGVNGYIRENDYMHFKVEVAVDGDTEISNDQVLFGMAGLEFECRPGTFYTGECEYTTTKDVRADAERYLINLYADGWTPGDPAVKTLDNFLYIDKDAPIVSSIGIENSQPASDGRIAVRFIVVDSAVSGCTGIRNVEFYDNDLTNVFLRDPDHNVVVDGPPGDCSETGYTIYTSGIQFGTGRVCLLPYDNFGQNAFELGTLPANYIDTWCIEFDIDRNAPNVVGGSLKIIDEDTGEEVAAGTSPGYYNTGGRTVSISVDIIEDDLATVYADFSQLNEDPSIAMSYQYLPLNVLTDCTLPDPLNLRTCTWTNIQLNPDGDGNRVISITATDNSFPPNEATQTVTRYFKLDNIGPLPTAITTLFYDASNRVTYSNASGNIFVAGLTEDDVGIDASDIKLHLYDVVATLADECTETMPGLWACIWNNFPTKADSDASITDEGIIPAYIDPSTSSDLLGNPAVQKYQEDIVFDLQSPIVTSITKSTDNIYGFYSNGYELTIVAEVTDVSPVTATAYLEDITVGAGEQTVQCFPTSGDIGETRTWQCEWITTIDTTLINDVFIDLTFDDFVGYTTSDLTSIPITKEEEAVIPDFFDLTFNTDYLVPIDKGIICNTDCSLPYLASEFYYQIAPFYLDVSGGEMTCPGTVTIIPDTDIIDGCQATYTMSEDATSPGSFIGFITYAIDIPNIMNYIAGDKDFIVVAPECYLKFKVKCETPAGTTVYAWPEAEKITLNVPFSDVTTPDGPEDFKKTIDGIKDKTETWFGIIDALNKIVTILQNICQIRSMITTGLQTISLIGIGFSVCIEGGSPWCVAPEVSLRGMTGGYAEWWEEFQEKSYLNAICPVVTCSGRDVGAPAEMDPKLKVGYDRWSTMEAQARGKKGKVGAKPKTACDFLRLWAWFGAGQLDRGRSGEFAGAASALQTDVLSLSKRSFIFASLCLCLPGIIYNIRKGIELECWKGICYRDLIPTGAVTKDDCDAQHDYNVCVYWLGNWFGWLLSALESPIVALATFLMNPWATGWEIVRMTSYKMCYKQAVTAGACVPGKPGCLLKWKDCGLYIVWQSLTNIAEMTQWEDTLGAMEWEWDDIKQGDQEEFCKILFED